MMLILKKIARQEDIEADANDRIAEKSTKFGMMQKVLQKEIGKGGGMKRLRDMLLAESTLEYLTERTI